MSLQVRAGTGGPARRVDSRKSAIVAADVRRLTLKKTNGPEPPYVGCYGFLNQRWAQSQPDVLPLHRVPECETLQIAPIPIMC